MNNWHGVHWGMEAYPITLGMSVDSLCRGDEAYFSDCFVDETVVMFSDSW